MTQKLTEFLQKNEQKQYATKAGSDMHLKMQRIVLDPVGDVGDIEIINKIKSNPELLPFFVSTARTEVPIAGVVRGVFLSRRIDRLLINDNTKTIDFIDYKTDVDKTVFIDKYTHQLNEYAELLHSVHPDYKINGYILWLHDWKLECVISI